jgi:choline dehydrogenase-like flavoprotein
MNTDFDCIIVGSGAGGAAAAWQLARAGQRVLLLEKGDELPQDGSTLDVETVFRQGRFTNHEAWRDGHGRQVVPGEYFNLGGKTKWYGAALLRFGADEFSADAARGYLGWPFGLDTLAPYYDQAEQLLGVRHFDYEPQLRRIIDGLTHNGSGWRAEPLPLGLSADILRHTEEAMHFDGFASVRGLKSDAERVFIDPVRALPNLTIMTDREVADLLASDDLPQRILGVACRGGQRYTARRVLLAAGAMHSPRLLQRHLERTGLARRLPSADLVGRYYKRHLLTAVLGITRAPQTDVLRKTVLLSNDRFPHSSVQTLGWMDGEIVGAQLPGYVPRAVADAIGRRAYGFWLTTEDGSHPYNRIDGILNGTGTPLLDYDPSRNAANAAEHSALTGDFRKRLFGVGYLSFTKVMPLGATAHSCGTLVAGNDPMQSVVDADGSVHGMENLYVVDGSVLPRSSRVNPALTIYAWSLRVAERLTQQHAGGVH